MENTNMPQPYRGAGFGYGPNTVLDRPELAICIANVCANWVLVEHDMAWLYALLLGVDLQRPKGSEPQFHPIAFQIFDALNSINARTDLLGRLCKERALHNEWREYEDSIKAEITKCFQLRSIFAHGLWAIDERLPDALILVGKPDQTFIYEKQDFEIISKRILGLELRLKNFTVPIWKRISADR